MGPPPVKFATAGRANSAGISCLYLANNIVTTLHEIRARDLDYISVAAFKLCKELRIVDLSNKVELYYINYLEFKVDKKV